MAQHAAPAHVVRETLAASQPGITKPTWKALPDPQGSCLYLGKQFPQDCPTSKLPASHQVKQAQSRLTLAHPIVAFLYPSFKDPSILALKFHCPTEVVRPTARSPRPGTPLPACSCGPEATAPSMGQAEATCWVWSSRFAAHSTPLQPGSYRRSLPASPQREVHRKSCF